MKPLVDTDILSEVLKAKDATVLGKAQQYLNQYGAKPLLLRDNLP